MKITINPDLKPAGPERLAAMHIKVFKLHTRRAIAKKMKQG